MLNAVIETNQLELKASFQKAVIESWVALVGSLRARICHYCKAHGAVVPKFEELQSGFKVTLLKEAAQETAQENTKAQILVLLAENPYYTRADLVKLLNKADGTIKQHLAELKESGKIERVGSNKSGYWQVLGNVIRKETR